jgi:transposase
VIVATGASSTAAILMVAVALPVSPLSSLKGCSSARGEVPSVGPLVAITYKSAMDDPNRIAKSKAAGAPFGLTPRKYQSGEKDVTSGITRAGDEMVRTALYEAANVLLSRITRFSKLKRWGIDVAKRRGSKRAKVALARKIAVILHRMWVDGSTYRWTETQPIAAQA